MAARKTRRKKKAKRRAKKTRKKPYELLSVQRLKQAGLSLRKVRADNKLHAAYLAGMRIGAGIQLEKCKKGL